MPKPFLRARRVRALRERKRFARENAAIRRHPCDERDRVTLIRELHRIRSRGRDSPPHPYEYATILGLAGRLGASAEGAQVHLHMIHCRLERQWKTITHLIRMYGRCGFPFRALRCFECLNSKYEPVWAATIMALAQNGRHKEARALFRGMIVHPCKPDEDSYIAVLHACWEPRNLEFGRDLHAKIGLAGLDSSPAVCCAVMGMYARCGTPELALEVFERSNARGDASVFSWIALIAAFSRNERVDEAMVLARRLLQDGSLRPSVERFVWMLSRYERKGERWHGEAIHGLADMGGLVADPRVAQALMRMYGKCAKISRARMVFDGFKRPGPYLWSTLIRAYASDRSERCRIFALFEEMLAKRVKPTQETIFTMASLAKSFEQIKAVHIAIVKNRCALGPVLRDLLIQKYKSCQCVPDGWDKYRQLHARFKQAFFA